MQKTKQRDKVLDALKLFASFLMVWGHSVQYFLSSNYWEEPIYHWMSSFRMPLFMMIVGYFSISLEKLTLWGIVSKKFRQLILPSLTFGVLLSLKDVYQYLNGDNVEHGITIFYNFVNSFWFLKSAFLCTILYFVIRKLCRNEWLTVVSCLVLSPFMSSILYYPNLMMPCFILGICVSRNISLIRQFSDFWMFVGGFGFVCLAFFWNEKIWTGGYNIPYFIYVLRISIGCCASLFLFLLFYNLSSKIRLGYIGELLCRMG